MATGMRVSAAVALAGAVACFLALPRRRPTAQVADPRVGSVEPLGLAGQPS
jgi:hypothetical protein